MNAITPDSSGLLQRAGDTLQRLFPEAIAAYAFGSVAEGRARTDSDLDLAVLGDSLIEPLQRLEMQRELGAALDRDVDLVELRSASTVLRHEVTVRGVLLFTRDAQRSLEFEARTLGDYAELMDATRALRTQVRERGRVYAQ